MYMETNTQTIKQMTEDTVLYHVRNRYHRGTVHRYECHNRRQTVFGGDEMTAGFAEGRYQACGTCLADHKDGTLMFRLRIESERVLHDAAVATRRVNSTLARIIEEAK